MMNLGSIDINSLDINSLDYVFIVDKYYNIVYDTRYDNVMNNGEQDYLLSDIVNKNFFKADHHHRIHGSALAVLHPFLRLQAVGPGLEVADQLLQSLDLLESLRPLQQCAQVLGVWLPQEVLPQQVESMDHRLDVVRLLPHLKVMVAQVLQGLLTNHRVPCRPFQQAALHRSGPGGERLTQQKVPLDAAPQVDQPHLF